MQRLSLAQRACCLPISWKGGGRAGIRAERVAVKEKGGPRHLAVSRAGMVATAHHRATAAGVEMLEAGGNAFDAAVAAAFALGVCEPAGSGLGGQTMALVHEAASGRTVAIDGSSRAPSRAAAGTFADRRAEARRGYRATTVPSTPAVLDHLRGVYGALPLPDALRPATRLAADGYDVSRLQHALARREAESLRAGRQISGRRMLRDEYARDSAAASGSAPSSSRRSRAQTTHADTAHPQAMGLDRVGRRPLGPPLASALRYGTDKADKLANPPTASVLCCD